MKQGLLQFAQENNMPVHYFNRDRLNEVAGIAESEYAMAALGVKAVAEPAAILAAGSSVSVRVDYSSGK